MAITFHPKDYFKTFLYTGNSTGRTFTDAGFQTDFVWIKDRGNSRDHMLFDAVRTATKDIHSNNDDSETTIADTLTAFTSNGFTLGTDATASSALVNGSSNNYVAWNWKAANSSGSSNSNGSITSTVSASTTSGFSIVKYTGTGSNATIGHGLGAVPEVIFVKKYNTTQAWRCGHVGQGWTHGNNLNNNSAVYDSDTYWQDTTPTTTVFSVGTDTEVNGSGATHIAYCFAEKRGFSHFGTYDGSSNADGVHVMCGFKPAWILIKSTASSTQWVMFDNKRGYNGSNGQLYADANEVEGFATSLDIVSNGFKLRATDNGVNTGHKYLYMAFAEEPFVASNGNPATAR